MIDPFDVVYLKPIRHALMGPVRLADDQESRRVLIDPMYNAGPRHPVYPRKLSREMI